MEKLLAIIFAVVGTLASAAFVVINVLSPFMNLYLSIWLAVVFACVMLLLAFTVSALTRINGDILRLLHKRGKEE